MADSNRTEDKDANEEVPKEKSVGEKFVDIMHNLISNSSDDPVTDTIKSLRKSSLIGGDYRKAKMDKAIKDSGG